MGKKKNNNESHCKFVLLVNQVSLYITVQYIIVLYLIVYKRELLYCTVLYCTVLYCTLPYYTVKYCIATNCTRMYSTIVNHTYQNVHCGTVCILKMLIKLLHHRS